MPFIFAEFLFPKLEIAVIFGCEHIFCVTTFNKNIGELSKNKGNVICNNNTNKISGSLSLSLALWG